MANTFKPKRSYTASNTPTLAAGELGINAADGKIWIGNAAGTANVLVSSLSLADLTGTLAISKGGTNITTYTTGDLLYSSATNTLAKLSGNTTTTKQFLSQTGTGSASQAPAWSTVSKSDVGLGSVENTALSTWAGSTNVTTLGTVGTGTWNATTIGLSKGGTNAALTAVNGGVAYSSASALALTAAGTSGQILKSNGAGAPTWMSTSSITSVGTLSGLTITETNAADNTLVINAASGQTGNLLQIKDATAVDLFVIDGTGGVTTGYLTSTGLTVNGLIYPSSDGTSGQVLSTNGSGTLSWTAVSSGSAAGSTGDIQYNDGSGGFTASSYFSYGSSAYDKLAIYSSATTDNVVGIFAASGQTGNLLTLRDYLGTTTYSYFDSVGNLYLNAQNDVRFADADSSNYAAIQAPATIATNYTLTLPTTAGTSNYVLKTNGSGTLSWTNAITNLIGGNSTTLLGSIPYQSNTDTTTLLAPNTTTTKKFLRQTGTGTNGAAPAWDTIDASDVPTLNQNTTGTAAGLSATLAIGSGGTGQTTANAAFNALAPSQTGNSGLYLTTNGTDASWSPAFAAAAPYNQNLQFNNNGSLGGVLNWAYDNLQYKMTVSHQSFYTALKIHGFSNVASNIVEIGTTTANVFSIYNTLDSFGAVTINKLLYLNGQGELRLNDADNSNYIALRSPATVTSNVTWTLPSTAGSNGNVLSTDGSGNLSWAASGTTIPAGSMQMFAGSSAPSGWLFCDGSAVSRTTYATLFSAIGTTYGAGNGSTTFNLPDCRGRTLIGVGQGSGLTNRTLGATTGTENHTLSLAEIPSHNHGGITGTMNSNTTHSHNVATRAGSSGGSFYRLYDRYADQSNVIATESTNTDHTHNISAAGSGSSHNNMQPSLAVNFIIKT